MTTGQIETGAGANNEPDAVHLLTPGRVAEWVVSAQPGARMLYHQGLYAGGLDGDRGDLNLLLQAYESRGMVYLVQRRRRGTDALDLPGFDYLAVRSSRPKLPDEAHDGARPRKLASLHAQAEALFAHNGRRAMA